MFSEKLSNELNDLISMGLLYGADFVEFFLEKKNTFTCQYENVKLSAMTPVLSLGAGVRVFSGEKDCYVSTNDISYSGLKSILLQALDILFLEKNHFNERKSFSLNLLKDYSTNMLDKDFTHDKDFIDRLNDLLSYTNRNLVKKTKQLFSSTVSCLSEIQDVIIASSEGNFVRDKRIHQTLSSQVVCVDGAHRTSCHKRFGHSGHGKLFLKNEIDLVTDELSESAGHMLHADFVQSGELPVIIANKFGGVIFHEACGHLLETTAVQRKSTPFLNKMEQKIANESVTAYDDGLWKNAYGSLSVDDEGLETEKTLLIEKGFLKNFLSDRAGEKLTQHKRTGSGRRQNYSFAPASRMRNTYIAPGQFNKEELFSTVNYGLYCKNLGGGSVSSSGDFNFAVEEGWMIENGKITKPVKGATLIGQAADTLMKISMVANDLEISPGFCGSVSGRVNVTVGQPHIKVDSMTIGGR